MFVLLGSNGHITGQLARRLLADGHRVRVVGRSAASLAPLVRAGAEAAPGDAADAAFLARAFAGAQAAYVMTPTGLAEPDLRAAQDRIGSAVARALQDAGVARVVHLSSIGAELPAGTGPIAGLHAQEQRLNAIGGLDLLHLRPGYFMENLVELAPGIETAGALSAMEAPDAPIPMACTTDIAAVAARELAQPKARGVLHLHAEGIPTMREAARAIGTAIGRPDLPYVQADPAETCAALLAQGVSPDVADSLVALARWLSGDTASSLKSGPAERLPTSLDAFVRERFPLSA